MTEHYTRVDGASASVDAQEPYALEHDPAFWSRVEEWQTAMKAEQRELAKQLVLPFGEERTHGT